ncbi:aminoglycoside 3'-phosphotransferase [Tessaracoccus lubricantis]|uniref:Aminoglycoside 3'-phosphotransferase n=1 Tax=Tessaracoccus lubricantis TaxID=545543 RepID=A0ABP9FL62_9ACTN
MSVVPVPPPGTPVPFAITKWAAVNKRRVDALVWQGRHGSITARLVADDVKPLYAKWSPHDLEPEAERLSWLSSRFPSPRMADYEELDDGWLIVTVGLPGRSAVEWPERPELAAHGLAEALAQLHSLDATDTLFDEPAWVGDQRDVHDLSIVHGAATVPNVLVSDDGGFVGMVGVGQLGVADRWADLAVASRSLEHHFGPGAADEFWAAYGEAPDPERIRRYRDAYLAA